MKQNKTLALRTVLNIGIGWSIGVWQILHVWLLKQRTSLFVTLCEGKRWTQYQKHGRSVGPWWPDGKTLTFFDLSVIDAEKTDTIKNMTENEGTDELSLRLKTPSKFINTSKSFSSFVTSNRNKFVKIQGFNNKILTSSPATWEDDQHLKLLRKLLLPWQSVCRKRRQTIDQRWGKEFPLTSHAGTLASLSW